jgi:hypothetical protein
VGWSRTAPTLTTIAPLTGAVQDSPFAITYDMIAEASDAGADDPVEVLTFRVEGISSGTLSKDGEPVEAGVTEIGPGESLFWTTAPGAFGTLDAFTVVLCDGPMISSPPVQVQAVAKPVPRISGTSGNDVLYVRLNKATGAVEVFATDPAPVPLYSGSLASLGAIDVSGGDGNDTLIIDVSNGSPIPPGGLMFHGGDGSNVLRLAGTRATDSLSVSTDHLLCGISPVTYANAAVELAGTVIALNSLSIGGSGKVGLPSGGNKVLMLKSLAISEDGTLDLTDNDMIIRAPPEAVPDGDPSNDPAALLLGTWDGTNHTGITGLIAKARNTMWNDGSIDRNWGGTGITSSTARSDTSMLTGIAVIRNIDALGQAIRLEWQTQPVTKDSILVKYTFNGDADVSGELNALDYSLINGGFLSQGTPKPMGGYRNGDFDFSGEINALDYSLINGAFLGQNSHTPPAPLAKVSSPFCTKKVAAASKVAMPVARKLSAKQKARLLARRHR